MKYTKPSPVLILSIIILVFSFLFISLTDFLSGKKVFNDSGPTLDPNINILSVAPDPQLPNTYQITWEITSPTPLPVTSTTIYYDTISTPSALTTTDSPSAPSYQFYLSDYLSGPFTSPGIFTATLQSPPDAISIFIRAYAHIDTNHYWTPEYTIDTNSL